MGFDNEIYLYVASELRIPLLRAAGRIAAGLEVGDQLASFCILFIMAGYLWQKPRVVKTFVGGLFALAAAGIAVQALKHLIGRARPALELGDFYFVGPHFSPSGFDAFPSGHTTAMFSLLSFFCRFYPGWSVPLYSAGFFLSVLARVITGQHFFTDVAGGAVLGSIVGALVARHFRGVIEASPAPPGATEPMPEATKRARSDERAGVAMAREILAVIAFSAAILLIGAGREFAPHLQSAFLGILTAIATYFLTRELCGKPSGVYAALILSSSLLFVNVCRMSAADTAWLFFTVLAFFAYVYSAKPYGKSNLLLVMSYASLGLALVAKGPLALFPAVIFLLHEYLREKPPFGWFVLRYGLRHGLLLAATIAVFALWLGPATAGYHEAADPLFFDEIAARTGMTRHAGRVIYVLPLLFAAFFPWTFFVLAYFVKEGRRWLRETAIDSHSLLLLLWATVVVGLFPFVAVKFPHTIILALPPLSCLAGRFIARDLPEASAGLPFPLLATFIVAAGLLIAAVIVYFVRPQYSSLSYAAPFAILTFSLAAAGLMKNKGRWPAFFTAICLGALGFYVSAALIALQA
jgi:membrane-associated phospholipid phosphatase